jgi:hypothetical protein
VRLGAASGLLAAAAFCVLAAAGLPIITRYLLLTGIVLAIFAGGGVFGWLELLRGARRTWWARFGALALVGLLVFLPSQARRIDSLGNALATQEEIQARLGDIVRDGLACEPLAVPNRRPIPLLALWLEREPAKIADAQAALPVRGEYLVPRTAEVARDYILDRRDRDRSLPDPPAGLRIVRRNSDWLLFRRCTG